MTNEQLPYGMKLAIDAVEMHCLHSSAIVSAIRTEHTKHVTLQLHVAGQAQRIAELEAERDEVEEDRDGLRNACDKQLLRIADLERLSEMHKNAWLYLQGLTGDGVIPITAGAHFSDIAVTETGKMLTRIDQLEIKCATLKRLHDAAVDERDELRAKLAEIEGQEPVAALHDDGYFTWSSLEGRLKYNMDHAGWRLSVYALPVPVIPAGWKSVPVEPNQAMREVMDEDGWQWADLLAAAEVITEAEYIELATPAPAIPAGWRLVKSGALAMVINALRRDAEEGRPVRGEMADELLAAAPEAAR